MKRYSLKEDKIILNEIKKSPENLKRAFQKASDRIGRTPLSIKQRWYQCLSKDEGIGAVTFITLSSRKMLTNKKNESKQVPKKVTFWRRLCNLLKGEL